MARQIRRDFPGQHSFQTFTVRASVDRSNQAHLPVNAAQARQRAIKLLRETGIPAAEARIGQYRTLRFSGGVSAW
jgi:peptide/nickel transport system ATP-binding protein